MQMVFWLSWAVPLQFKRTAEDIPKHLCGRECVPATQLFLRMPAAVPLNFKMTTDDPLKQLSCFSGFWQTLFKGTMFPFNGVCSAMNHKPVQSMNKSPGSICVWFMVQSTFSSHSTVRKIFFHTTSSIYLIVNMVVFNNTFIWRLGPRCG